MTDRPDIRKKLEEELMRRAGIAPAAPDKAPEAAASGGGLDRLAGDVLAIAAAALRLPEEKLDPTENLANYGIDSIAITEVMVQISRRFGISVAPTTFFEAKNLNDLARILAERNGKAIATHYAPKTPPASAPVPAPAPVMAAKPAAPEAKPATKVAGWMARHRVVAKVPAPATIPAAPKPPVRDAVPDAAAPIAIISMEGMFPKSPDLDSFAEHLRRGEDCIEEVPANRWDWRAVQGDPRKGPFTDVKYGGFVPGHDLFDAGFFNISPKEAELMDPQHRLFMECVWKLIERAGYAPGSLAGRKIGLFLGINLLDYTEMANRAGVMEAQQLTGLGHAFCPNRLSFLLDIHGPSQVIDTACSSSLVAVHRAVMSIRHEGCEMAIAGGSNLMLSPMQHIMFSQVGMICQDGRCKSFSAAANGYARADGVGALLLKRLDAAERDGDTILGVILASAEHHGGGATSLTAPNPQAQARLIVETHRAAGIDPRSVGLIECHGTGTKLGDPVEIEGLKLAFAELYRERGLPMPAAPHCGLGSVKSNIGHAETAAGVAGLIKVLLALRDGTRYRSLHCETPNPLIDLAGTPFHLLQQASPWPRVLIDGVEQPRRAGLSSFGAGGANAHLVIEEYIPAAAPAKESAGPFLLPVSARSKTALRIAVEQLRPFAETADLADLAYTLQVGRDAMRERMAFVANDRAGLLRQIDDFLKDGQAVHRGTAPRAGKGETLDPAGLSPHEIAARWAAGATIGWATLHEGQARRRLTLPTYPFERKRYWLPLDEEKPADAGGFKLTGAGPDRYTVRLAGTEFFLADHRVQGKPVLPGVAYLELARAAAAKAGLPVPQLRKIVWLKPLMVTAPVTVEVTLNRAAGGTRIEIASLGEDGARELHAQMLLADGTAEPAPSVDLDTLRAAHPHAHEPARIYAAFAALGLEYGPGHRALVALATGDTGVVARLRLPDSVAGAGFALHPSLLDGGFQAAIGMALNPDGTPSESGAALPFALESVELLRPVPADCWVAIRPAAGGQGERVRTLDLDLLDEAGALCVRLRGFATRILQAQPANTVLHFAPDWLPVPAATVDPAGFAARHALLIGLDTPQLPGWDCRALSGEGLADYSRQLLGFLQALLPVKAPVLVQIVLSDGSEAPMLAALSGMLRSAHLEHGNLWGQIVRVEPGLSPSALAARLQMAAGTPQHALLRFHDGRPAVQGWREVAVTQVSPAWRADGVYLIAGGAGALGRLLADDIRAHAPSARIVLAGRRAPGAALPENVTFRPVDLTDAASVESLVAGIRREHGRLDGVIQAAGLLRDRALAGKTTEDLAEVLAPKLAGTLNLDRAIGDQPLDFFLLFSSLSGALGNPGQADYAIANAFLDGFAEAREARRAAGACQGRTVSVAWPLWRDGGMRMDAASEVLMTRTTGLVPLVTADGLAAIHAALAGTEARLLVAPGDAARLRRRLLDAPEPPVFDKVKPAIDTGALRAAVLDALMRMVSAQLKVGLDDLAPDIELTEYGFDSISFTQFANALNDRFALELTPTLFFEHPTLDGLAAYLASGEPDRMAAALGVAATAPAPVAAAVAAPAAKPASQPLPKPMASDTPRDAIAIIGMSGVLPGAADVNEFWRNLVEGRDCIGEIPPERWDWREIWGDPVKEPGRSNVKWGGFIDGIGAFDAGFFGLSAPEARAMDPQQRLLLTQAWRVIEDAGYAPRSLSGSRTGVFVGIADTGYGRLAAASGAAVEGYAMTGLAPSLGPNRISYFLNLHGPSVAVETACSSALVAIHRAVEAIRSGGCDAAIAGGVNMLLLPDSFIGFSRAGMLSPDGRSKPFSDAANGYARGEGLGLVFLKRLADAERDGDRILAVVRASAENHGGRAGSLTAPNPKAQAELLRTAYRQAGFDPRTVSYIEAHGTGTKLGDPIEVEGLRAAFADLTKEAEASYGPGTAMACGIGSVKSNIGHLELAAGAAGVLKLLLQMRHGQLVKTLHCDALNPYLKLEGSPFDVVRENRPWPRTLDATGREVPRRAGVSSFGFGGSNAHLVLEEYVAPEQPVEQESGPALILLSARTPEQLRESARLLRDAVAAMGNKADLHAIAWTLQVARDAMEHRLAFQAADIPALLDRLTGFLDGRAEEEAGLHVGQAKQNRAMMAVLESDAELNAAVAGLADRGRADTLLQLWAGGLAVDWRALRKGRPARRITLPGYPFDRTIYWVGGKAAPTPQVAPAEPPVIPAPPAPAPVAESAEDRIARALAAVTAVAARVLEVEASVLDPDTELGEFGFDSITMTAFASAVNEALGLSLTPADFFEFATLSRLAAHIAGEMPALDVASPPPPAPAPAVVQPVARSLGGDNDPIAIVGLSCRFPKAADAGEFWANLLAGRDCMERIPADRWDWRAYDGDPKREPNRTNIHWGGFIDGVFEFDPLFFGISPREAKLMDPQQRLMLMHAWKAIEDAGHAPRSLAGRSVGVFVGTSSSGYREVIGEDTGGEGYVATGAVPSVGPNRISYFFDWHGPSEPVETACSSSLVALHRALEAMRNGDCEMALVGGVNSIITPEAHINFAKAGMLAPDGRCKTFSKDADGYGRGEGVGIIFLKRLSEAQRDGDPVYAILRGSAVNHGGRANSLTAPNTAAQAALLVQAYRRAGIDPRTVSHIETHGTGTALGDPIEVNALKSAFRDLYAETAAATYENEGCWLGAVKSNIGHLELAAGIAGIAKVLLEMRHGTLAASLHCAEQNPYIELTGSPFRILRESRPWARLRDTQGREVPRRAGISSFGFGGVNAHVVLEEYVPSSPVLAKAGPVLIVLSARDEARLREQASRLLAALEQGRFTDADLTDIAHTLQQGREAMRERLAFVAGSLAEVRERLDGWLAGVEGSVVAGRLNAGSGTPDGTPDKASSPEEIARHWVAGGAVAWESLGAGPRRRLHLPTYPFAREIYNVAGAAATAVAADAPYALTLHPDAFYLRDHRFRGGYVLPGAMSLELARRAYTGNDTGRPVLLRQVVWQQPVLVAAALPVTVALVPGEGGDSGFRLTSNAPCGAEEILHVRGSIGPLAESVAPVLDLPGLRARCPENLSPDWLYECYAALGLEYGPSFRPVRELRRGAGEALAHLVLPEGAQAAAEQPGEVFGLHPSLLDGAFQACIALVSGAAGGAAGGEGGEAKAALPFVLERLELLRPLPTAAGDGIWAHLRLRPGTGGVLKFDIDLADDEGRLYARLRGFTVRVAGRTTETEARPEAPAPLRQAVEAYLAGVLARETGIDIAQIEPEAAFEAYGIDSVLIVRLTDVLEADFEPLPRTLFFEHQTLAALAGYFLDHHAARLAERVGGKSAGVAQPLRIEPAVRRGVAPVASDQPIAIIGLAGRYPGARDLDEFWANLAAGRDGITEVPLERWDHSRLYDPALGKPGKTNSKWGGFLAGFDRFDPLFFNIAPREADYMDPQERLFLQCAWETLEDAGHTRASLSGADVGVFVGVMYEEYQLYGAEKTQAGQPMALGGSAASIANRVSYFCDFHGPSLALDSMCSSSLTAIHLAIDSLRGGGCSVALAGGVNLTLHPNKYLALSQGRFMSSKGRCESFGAGGDGYVPGEGVGAVLLKPLDRALADGDRIQGVIRGSMLNHGGKTNGYTVPNPNAQADVIGRALDRAGVSPRAISYVEAHGTGTSLGDPIEIAALTKAYKAETDETGFCAIGSVKSNIGHCESAAGIAGLTKLLLQMRHGRLVPSLHSTTLNPGIDFAATPFRVQRDLAPWRAPVLDGREMPRLAGLSSFGAGGSNAHLVIEEFRQEPASDPLDGPTIFPFSARDPERLAELLARHRAALENLGEGDMATVACTLQEGREAFEERLAVVADSRAALLAALGRVLAGERDVPGVHRGRASGFGAPVTGLAGPQDLARAWAAGGRVDWRGLRGGKPARRIGLPAYPFARDRYWVPGGVASHMVAQSVQPSPLPLLFAPDWRAQHAGGDLPADRIVTLLCGFAPERMAQAAAILGPDRAMVLASGGAALADRYTDHAAEMLARLQALFRDRPAKPLVQLLVPLDGEESLLEGLGGLLRSAVQERPGLRCQTIGVAHPAADLAALARAEQGSADADIRHIETGRQVRHWREIAAHAVAPSWKAGGVYLVTGGAGGLGLLLCREIAQNDRKPVLWLTGRSALSEARRAALDALPATVIYRPVDMTDAASVRALADEIYAAHGLLDGVIHAAGITHDRLLVRKDAAELRAVLAPKVAGLANLDAALSGRPLGFLLLFASAAGALGNAGQADYAAGNAFLDAFAAHRNNLAARGQRQGRTLSLDWPYWRAGGMAMAETAVAAAERAVGVRPLESEAAFAALNAAMTFNEQQILVLDGDHDRLRAALMPEGRPEPMSEAIPERAASPARVASAPLRDRAVAFVARHVGAALNIPAERLNADSTLDRYGVDSVSALQIVEAMERELGPLPATLLLEYPRISALAGALAESHGTAFSDTEPAREPQPEPQVAAQPQLAAGDIAIIAVAGRYPGADTPEEFWQALRDGRDLVTEVPAERWDHAALYAPEKGRPGTSHCKWGGFLTDIDRFDAGFFGYTPREAALADPQERLFLQTAWHLLERAGHTRAVLAQRYGSRVGVFVGAMYQHYRALEMDADSKALLNLASYAGIANRLSYFLDLQGPSVAVDSMCSSGLQAVHQACQSLRLGECRLAIAGGVNLSIIPDKYLALSRAGLVGSDANSRSFADGDGYLPAEGVGAVLLKPLAEALRDGDAVLAVVKASAANHAGHSAGYAVPGAEAQARLIEENLRAAGVDARTISYVEAAANGSPLGDAIELRALTRAFRAFTAEVGFCAIGSVKANMGHAEAASGMAQLTKVLLQLQHRELAPSIRPGAPNPKMDFAGTPFVPQAALAPWRAPVIGGVEQPRRATVSSFGAGGSNVHLVLEEAPVRPVAIAEVPRRRLFPVSARTPEQLTQVLVQLAAYVRANPDIPLARLSHTLRTGREAMEHRAEIVASSPAELLAALDSARPGQLAGEVVPEEPVEGPPLVLPPYPFARDRHWIGKAAIAPVASHLAAATGDVPGDALGLIAEVLAAELGVDAAEISADAEFRAQGADSMASLRLIHRLHEVTGVEVSHADLERLATPAALAGWVETRRGTTLQPAEETAPVLQPENWQSPLSEGQRALWVWQALYPDSAAYNVPLGFRLSGVDRAVLERACGWLLARFPMLTARVLDDGGEVRLVGQTPGTVLRDIAVPAGADPLNEAQRRAALPFDLGEEPPVRFELLRRPDMPAGDGLLLIVAHHIAFDGMSALVLAQLLRQAYDRISAGAAPVEPAAADYADFVGWERDFVASPKGQAQLAYWRARLAGDLPALALPEEKISVLKGGVAEPAHLEKALPPELVARARAVAARLGITPSGFFLGVFAMLLHRLTGEQDIVIGMPVLRRPEARFARSIGFFANMVALRASVAGEAAAADILRDVQAQVTAALDNADYPHAAVARAVKGRADGQPLYRVSYAYQNFLGRRAEAIADGLTPLEGLRQQPDGPLGLELYEAADGLHLVAGYDAARFDEAAIVRLLERFARLTAAICADAAQPVASLDLLRPAERKRLLKSWARGGRLERRKGNVAQWIAEMAARQPNAIALQSAEDGATLSYRRLWRRSMRLAAGLRARGVGRGDRVAVLLPRGPECVASLLACLACGAVWVPLDVEQPDARLALVLTDASPALLVSDASGVARLDNLPGTVPPILDLDREKRAIKAMRPLAKPMKLRRKDPAYMIYTSGSTGQPKGVLVSQGALAEHCAAAIQCLGLTRRDSVLHFSPPTFDPALEQILTALTIGGRLVIRGDDLWSPAELMRVLRDRAVTVADLPPAYLREALLAWSEDGAGDGETAPPPALRLLIVGGEAAPPDLPALWRRGPLRDARLLNAYGPTETTVTCTLHEVTVNPTEGALPIGRPLPGTEAYILDPAGNPVPEGVAGELHIGGRRLALGYHGRPDLTQARFVTRHLPGRRRPVRLYRTGDRASFIPGSGGLIAFHGRIDQQVKLRGFRIEPGEIEAALRACGMRDAAVIVQGEGTAQRLVAYVVSGAQGPGSEVLWETELRARLARLLLPYMVPAAFVMLPALPVLPSGKLDRAALPPLPDSETQAGDAGPRDPLEAELAGLWRDVLDLPEAAVIGVVSDFFALGGHSLLALRLQTRIRQHFGRALPIAALIASPVLAQQADLLRVPTAAAARPEGPALVALRTEGARPALFLIHPVGGSVACYRDLARRLRPGRPVVGLQAAGIDPGEQPFAGDLAGMAAAYIAALRRRQPGGPYHLAGWSMGGVLAFEMARQMEETGQPVGAVALIESYTPALLRSIEEPLALPGEGEEVRQVRAFARDLLGLAEIPPLQVAEGRDPFAALLLSSWLTEALPGMDSGQLRRLFAVFRAHGQALTSYAPRPCGVPVTLLAGEAVPVADLSRGWEALTGGGLDQHTVPGDHYSILQPPGLNLCAAILDAALSRAEGGIRRARRKAQNG